MNYQRGGLPLLAAVLVALSGACAPAVEDVPQRGSQLAPAFRPDPEKPRKQKSERDGRDRQQPAASRTAAPKPGDSPTQASSPTLPAEPATTAPPADPAPTTARVSDASGDVSGLGGSPAYVDLTRATLTRDGGRYRLAVETGGSLPRRQDGDRTMNVVGFVDNDLDGTVDHEVWATLADNGWGTSSRHPDGARFGDDSGVSVTVSGSTITLAFAAGVIGGTDTFQWSVASEHGTLEQVASGTTAQDYGPDRGAVAFPG